MKNFSKSEPTSLEWDDISTWICYQNHNLNSFFQEKSPYGRIVALPSNLVPLSVIEGFPITLISCRNWEFGLKNRLWLIGDNDKLEFVVHRREIREGLNQCSSFGDSFHRCIDQTILDDINCSTLARIPSALENSVDRHQRSCWRRSSSTCGAGKRVPLRFRRFPLRQTRPHRDDLNFN